MADLLRPNDAGVLAQYLDGEPVFLGVIVASTTKNNSDTATPFSNTGNALAGKVLMIQSDAACYVYPSSTSTGTVTGTATGNGVYLAANDARIITMRDAPRWLACVAVTGTANLKVWELR